MTQREIPSTHLLYEALVESSEDAILALGLDNKILTCNRAAETMFDYEREDLIGQSVFQLVPLGRGGHLQEKLKRIRNGGRVEHYETVRMRKDGTRFPVSLRISPIKNGSGELVGLSWILRDVSEMKSQSARIQKLACVVEQTADSVMISDIQGVVEYVNPAFISTTGYSAAEVIGRPANILKSGRHPREFYTSLWETILSGRPFRATMTNKKKNGELYFTEKTITPISVTTEPISHFVSTDKDITDRKRAEEKARESLEKKQSQWEKAAYELARANAELKRFASPIETSDLVKQATVRLEQVLTARSATVQMDGLPRIYADEVRFAQLFQNLMAYLLHERTSARPEIRISAERTQAGWTFCFADKGKVGSRIGRLLRRRKFFGSSAGLSTCHPIVEKRGGMLWAKGGSVFFTVPDELPS